MCSSRRSDPHVTAATPREIFRALNPVVLARFHCLLLHGMLSGPAVAVHCAELAGEYTGLVMVELQVAARPGTLRDDDDVAY